MSDTKREPTSKPSRVLVICPDERPAVPALCRHRPLALLPLLGRTVLEHALSFLAAQGTKEVTLLASHQVDLIRAAVGQGEAWGLKLEVMAERRELSAAEARAHYGRGDDLTEGAAEGEALVLDRLPQLPEQPLWESYRAWFEAVLAFLPQAAQERVGLREIAPGFFVGMRSQLDPTATLTGPCWIGENVHIGSGAAIGPNTVIEDGAYIEDSAEVTGSIIGPQTYVGALTQVRHSFAWGRDLLNLQSGSHTEIVDGFLLDDLNSASQPRHQPQAAVAAAPQPLAAASLLRHALPLAANLFRK